jgi:uncharacterized protein YjbJ (UPF0337 family)
LVVAGIPRSGRAEGSGPCSRRNLGEIADDPSLRREGSKEERKGEAKDELSSEQERADRKTEAVADLERRTS